MPGMASLARISLFFAVLVSWSLRPAHATDVALDCPCGFWDPSSNTTWTDAIITYPNETSFVPADTFIAENFQHKWEDNINAVYRQGAIPDNIQFATIPIQTWNVTALQFTLQPSNKNHAVVGASMRSVRRDILYGRFETYIRAATQNAGGSAMSMMLRYNHSQSIDLNVMNTDDPSHAWTSFLLNGEYQGERQHGVNFSDFSNATVKFKGSPWNFVPYRVQWNASEVGFYVGDALLRNVTAKKSFTKPPKTPSPLYFQHWSLGDRFSTYGPPKEPSPAYVGLIRAFFNSSQMTKADHVSYDKKCNFKPSCNVNDKRLRGYTHFTVKSLLVFKEPKLRYTARWPAILILSVSSGLTLFLLIHTFFKRAPWKKVTVVHGHGAPAPPPPPPAPAPHVEEVLSYDDDYDDEKKKGLVPGPLKPVKSTTFSETATLIGQTATPGANTPGHYTPGHYTPGHFTPGHHTPGVHTPRGDTPPLPEGPGYHDVDENGEKIQPPSFDFGQGSQRHVHYEDDYFRHEDDIPLGPLERLPGSKVSLASSSTLGDAPEIKVTKPSSAGLPRYSITSSHYSGRSVKNFNDDTFTNPFQDQTPFEPTMPKAYHDQEWEEQEEVMEREMDELHVEFDNYDETRPASQMVERAERAEHTRAPRRQRVDYLAGLVAFGCLMVSMTHVSLTFLPAVQQNFADAHYKSERFAYKFITPFLLLFSWIGPFFTTSARFLVVNYLEHGDLLNIAEKAVGRTPRLIIPCAAVAALQFFAMQMGAISWLDSLPSVSWSTWPYTATFPNFGNYLSEVMQLMYIIPNSVPIITFNYCTGVLWTIPVQLQNSWLTLLGLLVIFEIKTPWKRFAYYFFCILNHWYAVSWGSFFWAGLLIADLDVSFHWKHWIYARPHVHYPILLICTAITIGSQSTDLVPRFNAFQFDTVEAGIHPDIMTGKSQLQVGNVQFPPYYVPRLSALTFAISVQLLVELSPFLQRLLSAGWLMQLFPHVLSVYLIHGFIFWSWGAFICVHLSAASIPYWANMLITILSSYFLIFLSLPLLTPIVDTLGKTISQDIWEFGSTKPAPRRRTLYPFPITLFEGALENDGGNLKDVERNVPRDDS